jgi:hypothetical protein
MILAFDRDERLGPRRAVSSRPRGRHPLQQPSGHPAAVVWPVETRRKIAQESPSIGCVFSSSRTAWPKRHLVRANSVGSTECPSLTGRQSSSGLQAPRRGDRNQTARGFIASPRARPPDECLCSALARGHRGEGENDHPLGLRVRGAAEGADGLEEGKGGVQAPARWRGREVDYGRAGQFRIGDGRARSDADRGHQSSAYLRAAL